MNISRDYFEELEKNEQSNTEDETKTSVYKELHEYNRNL